MNIPSIIVKRLVLTSIVGTCCLLVSLNVLFYTTAAS